MLCFSSSWMQSIEWIKPVPYNGAVLIRQLHDICMILHDKVSRDCIDTDERSLVSSQSSWSIVDYHSIRKISTPPTTNTSNLFVNFTSEALLLIAPQVSIRHLLLSIFHRALCVDPETLFDVEEVITVQRPRRC